MGQVGAAAMQMQMGTRLRHGHASLLRLCVEEFAAIPRHGSTQVPNRIVRALRRDRCEPVVLKHVVDARLCCFRASRTGGNAQISALLAHAEFGGHGDDQFMPVGDQSQPINRCLLQAPFALSMGNGFSHQVLQWPTIRVTEGSEIGRSTQGCRISCEADIGEMPAAVSRRQFDDAAVVGDAPPDR